MNEARLEHTNFTVSDAAATASWMEQIFGWHIRWQGAAKNGGHSIHIGTDEWYLAVFSPKDRAVKANEDSYATIGGLNHLAVVVSDLDAVEKKVNTHGFKTHSQADYEPGRRFYFDDADGIEFEVVQY